MQMGYRARKSNELIPSEMTVQRVKLFNSILKEIKAEDEKPTEYSMPNVTIKTG